MDKFELILCGKKILKKMYLFGSKLGKKGELLTVIFGGALDQWRSGNLGFSG